MTMTCFLTESSSIEAGEEMGQMGFPKLELHFLQTEKIGPSVQ